MCEIIIAKNINDDIINYIYESAILNPDGFGCLTQNGAKKSLNINDIILSIQGQPWAIIHTRAATHGIVSKSNCHPFYIGNGWYIFMNGTLPLYHETKSDTKLLAEIIKNQPIEKITQFLKATYNNYIIANSKGYYYKIGTFSKLQLSESTYIITTKNLTKTTKQICPNLPF